MRSTDTWRIAALGRIIGRMAGNKYNANIGLGNNLETIKLVGSEQCIMGLVSLSMLDATTSIRRRKGRSSYRWRR